MLHSVGLLLQTHERTREHETQVLWPHRRALAFRSSSLFKLHIFPIGKGYRRRPASLPARSDASHRTGSHSQSRIPQAGVAACESA